MKYFFYAAMICVASVQARNASESCAITYERNGGRLGDDIQSFAQAFYLGYKHNMQLLFQPFDYSDQLKVHYCYPHYTKKHDAQYKHKIKVKGSTTKIENLKNSCLYVSLFEEFPGTDWHDEGFIDALCKLIAPVKDFAFQQLPADMHTIAIHIRRGGGFRVDTDWCKKVSPLHFPNIEYYANALNGLLMYLEGPCYIYVFTDDQNPTKVVEELLSHCLPEDLSRITVDFRHTTNRHDAHVLEDFFDIMRFTYLIRARSGYSLFAERLGNCKISISPTKASSGNPWGNVHEVAFTFYADRTIQRGSIAAKTVPIEKLRQKEGCNAELAAHF